MKHTSDILSDRLWNRFEQTGSIEAYLAWRGCLTDQAEIASRRAQEETIHEGEQGQRADHQRSPYGGQGQTSGHADP